jgi:hypothetical protein
MRHRHNRESCQIRPIVAASNSSVQTTNARSGLSLLFFRADTLSENNSMENRAADTRFHILLVPRFHQWSGSGGNWHYR